MLTQQQRDLSQLTQELVTLNSKVRFTKDDERRSANLASMISAVKAGATLAEIQLDQHNEHARKSGLPLAHFTRTGHALTAEQESEARAWKHFVETRAGETEGNLLNAIGTYTGLGYFVPTALFFIAYEIVRCNSYARFCAP